MNLKIGFYYSVELGNRVLLPVIGNKPFGCWEVYFLASRIFLVSVGRKPEKIHDFRQSVDELFPRVTIYVQMGGRSLDYSATEALRLKATH